MGNDIHPSLHRSQMENAWMDNNIRRRQLTEKKSYGECPGGCMEMVFGPGEIEGDCWVCDRTIRATTTDWDDLQR